MAEYVELGDESPEKKAEELKKDKKKIEQDILDESPKSIAVPVYEGSPTQPHYRSIDVRFQSGHIENLEILCPVEAFPGASSIYNMGHALTPGGTGSLNFDTYGCDPSTGFKWSDDHGWSSAPITNQYQLTG